MGVGWGVRCSATSYHHGDECVPWWSCAKLQAETGRLIPFSVSGDAAIRHTWGGKEKSPPEDPVEVSAG